MARLPVVGDDLDAWGGILNEFLEVAHNADGSLKADPSTAGGAPAFVVAASDAPLAVRNRADYVCDGTDDDVEINAAITALPTGGGMVALSPGTFTVARNALTLRSNLMLSGAPGLTVIKLKDNADGGTPAQNVRIISSSTTLTDVTIDGVIFDGNGANQSDYSSDPAVVEANRDSRSLIQIRNITRFRFLRSGARNGRHGATLRMYNCDDAVVAGCEFRNNNLSSVGICDCTFIGSSLRYRAVGNLYHNATDTGTAMDGVIDAVVSGNLYVNCALGIGIGFCNSEGGGTARSSARITITGNTIIGPNNSGGESQGVKVGSFGHAGDGNNNREITITANTIAYADRAIWLDACNDTLISGNILAHAVGTNRQLILIAASGVTVNHVDIVGNRFLDTNNRGVGFASGESAGVFINNNRFRSVTTPVHFSTSGGTHTLVEASYNKGWSGTASGSPPTGGDWIATGNRA